MRTGGGTRARPTTLQDVVQATGPLFKVKDSVGRPREHPDRYIIFGVSGYGIRPSTLGAGSGPRRSVTTTWCVLDSLNAYLEVARFIPSGNLTTHRAQQRARAVAAMMNRVDRGA